MKYRFCILLVAMLSITSHLVASPEEDAIKTVVRLYGHILRTESLNDLKNAEVALQAGQLRIALHDLIDASSEIVRHVRSFQLKKAKKSLSQGEPVRQALRYLASELNGKEFCAKYPDKETSTLLKIIVQQLYF